MNITTIDGREVGTQKPPDGIYKECHGYNGWHRHFAGCDGTRQSICEKHADKARKARANAEGVLVFNRVNQAIKDVVNNVYPDYFKETGKPATGNALYLENLYIWLVSRFFDTGGKEGIKPIRFAKGEKASVGIAKRLGIKFNGGSEWDYWKSVRDRLKGVAKTFFILTGVKFKALFYRKPTAEELEAKRRKAYGRVLRNVNRTLDERTTTSLVNRYERDPIVSSYVLARANGSCELCGDPARFTKAKDGSPYLEPHHVVMVSKDGPDHPRWVGAVHGECHNELHYGVNRVALNEKLMGFLASLEGVAQA